MEANWIGLILSRNCVLKNLFEGKIEGRNDRKTRVET
jgi:hypothetical protein